MSLYTWTERWAELPQEPLGWMHSGVAVTDGFVVVAHPGRPALLYFDINGELDRTIALDLVHRFAADGRHVQTLSGDEGGGRFDRPHGVVVDRRRGEPELYVSDRANARIQVYDLDGRFRRLVGEGIVVTPTDMAIVGDTLALTDFTQARVTILDGDDQLVEHIGANPEVRERDGWPNARNTDGDLVRPPLEPGKFNSPHTLAADAEGNLYVTEWLIGGRLTKLTRNA